MVVAPPAGGRAGLRISPNFYNTEEEVERLVALL